MDLRYESSLHPPFYGTEDTDALIDSRGFIGYTYAQEGGEPRESPKQDLLETYGYGITDRCLNHYITNKIRPGGINDRLIQMGQGSNLCTRLMAESQATRPYFFREYRNTPGRQQRRNVDYILTGFRKNDTTTYPVRIWGTDETITYTTAHNAPMPINVHESKKLGQNPVVTIHQLEDNCFKAVQALLPVPHYWKSCFATWDDGQKVFFYEYHPDLQSNEEKQKYKDFFAQWPSGKKEKPSLTDYPKFLPGCFAPIITEEDINKEFEKIEDRLEETYRNLGRTPPERELPGVLDSHSHGRVGHGYFMRAEGAEKKKEAFKIHLIYTYMLYTEGPTTSGLQYRKGMHYRVL